MRKTPAGAMFYMDLVRDRLLLALKKKFGGATRVGKARKGLRIGAITRRPATL